MPKAAVLFKKKEKTETKDFWQKKIVVPFV